MVSIGKDFGETYSILDVSSLIGLAEPHKQPLSLLLIQTTTSIFNSKVQIDLPASDKLIGRFCNDPRRSAHEIIMVISCRRVI